MNWIFYALINLAKFFAVSGLLLLLILALPMFASLFVLGAALGHLRELESHGLQNKNKSTALYFQILKFEKFLIWPTKTAPVQHIRVQRYKSRF